MISSETIRQLVQNEAFINGVIALGAILVIARFVSFVHAQYRDGLYSYLAPCSDCGNRLSPSAAFCPQCGRVLKEMPAIRPPGTSVSNGKSIEASDRMVGQESH